MVEGYGYGVVILKSDQEPSILALKNSIREGIRGDVRMEESPVGEHQSNGMIENAVQRVQGQFRVIRDGLEARIGKRLDGNHKCIPWMVRHAAQVVNRYQMGSDGKTAYRRLKGRDFRRDVPELGQRILYLKAESVGIDKATSRWDSGIFLRSEMSQVKSLWGPKKE